MGVLVTEDHLCTGREKTIFASLSCFIERVSMEPPSAPMITENGRNLTGRTTELFTNGLGDLAGTPVFEDLILYYCLDLSPNDTFDDSSVNSARQFQAPGKSCPNI